MIEAQLPSNWRGLADEFRLIPAHLPPQLGAKVTDIAQPLRLVFYHVPTNCSLRTATAMGAAAQIVEISPVALHLWMRKLEPCLAALLELTTDSQQIFAPERWTGYDIRAGDATVITRPGACTTTARVHYALQLTSLRPDQLDVTDETGGETFRRFEPAAGQLWLGDRAYANPPGIDWVCSTGADVLVRYNRGSLPLYDVKGYALDVPHKLSRLGKPGRVRGWAGWVHPAGTEEAFRGRLCTVRLPPDKAEEARQRLRKEQGRKVSQDSLHAAEFVVVFTTAPQTRLVKERVLELYGLRWQVELHTKRDKSIARLDKLPNFRPDTIFSWLCAKLLLAQIVRQVARAEVVFPRCA
jgi:hypothetical protein